MPSPHPIYSASAAPARFPNRKQTRHSERSEESLFALRLVSGKDSCASQPKMSLQPFCNQLRVTNHITSISNRVTL
jgi:hypothetical protein